MSLKDTDYSYGAITKFLHWSIALLIICQVFLVYWKRFMLPEGSELGKFFIGGLHKPLGVVVLGFAVCAILWRWCNVKPEFPANMPTWKIYAAKITHFLLYVGMLIMPISGLIMTTASGYPIDMFGVYQLPIFIEQNKELGKLMYGIHEATSFALLALVALHTLAALEHHFVKSDNVLTRMLPFGK